MSFEESLQVVVAAQLRPMVAELRALREEMTAVRRALPPLLLTPSEAAKALRCSVKTIRRRMADGSLPVCRNVGQPRVDIGAMQPAPDAEVLRIALEMRAATPRANDE